MTGFGFAEAETPQHRIRVEIKSLNSKFLDFNFRMPRELNDREPEIKTLLGNHLKRGKINFSIELEQKEILEPNVKINEALFKSYYEKYKGLAGSVAADSSELFKLALQSPDVITNGSHSDDMEWEEIQNTILKAIEKCGDFRKHEGDILQKKMTEYIESIRSGLITVGEHDPNRLQSIKDRLNSSIDEIRERVQIDQNRFEQELIYYLEKLDITEEKVRLGKHLDYFLEVMDHAESQGKKMGFIAQEIGREINTIGAKANDAVIQRAVVSMKDELEKIKEQSMNIL